MKTTKKFLVNIDMKWSHDIVVTAKNKTEAKNKAFARFHKVIASKKFQFNINTNDN